MKGKKIRDNEFSFMVHDDERESMSEEFINLESFYKFEQSKRIGFHLLLSHI
jgi:hypothetical protein